MFVCSVRKSLGGTNDDPINLMPQWQSSNRMGRWVAMERAIEYLARKSPCQNGAMTIDISLEYLSTTVWTPIGGRFQVSLNAACQTLSQQVSMPSSVTQAFDPASPGEALIRVENGRTIYRTKWYNGPDDYQTATGQPAQWDKTSAARPFHLMVRSNPPLDAPRSIIMSFTTVDGYNFACTVVADRSSSEARDLPAGYTCLLEVDSCQFSGLPLYYTVTDRESQLYSFVNDGSKWFDFDDGTPLFDDADLEETNQRPMDALPININRLVIAGNDVEDPPNPTQYVRLLVSLFPNSIPISFGWDELLIPQSQHYTADYLALNVADPLQVNWQKTLCSEIADQMTGQSLSEVMTLAYQSLRSLLDVVTAAPGVGTRGVCERPLYLLMPQLISLLSQSIFGHVTFSRGMTIRLPVISVTSDSCTIGSSSSSGAVSQGRGRRLLVDDLTSCPLPLTFSAYVSTTLVGDVLSDLRAKLYLATTAPLFVRVGSVWMVDPTRMIAEYVPQWDEDPNPTIIYSSALPAGTTGRTAFRDSVCATITTLNEQVSCGL